MNHHLKQFNRMLRVGSAWGHESRVAGASTSTNVPPPPKYGLRKDHKNVPPGQESSGPDLRPVAGADQAPNSRLSHFLSKIVNNYADCEENTAECNSSEEMRAAIEAFNQLDQETRTKCRIISMDVKSLYPSMSWDGVVMATMEMIQNSDMVIQNVDWHEVGKYLAVMMTKEEIQEEGLGHVIPKRRDGERRLRRITVNYLQQKQNKGKWLNSRKPGVRQQRRMLALAVSFGIKACMSNHTYKVGDVMYLQASGGPIGLELTGAVSRPFMMYWDRVYLDMVKAAGVDMKMYERYIDDSNQVAVVPPPGSWYDSNQKKVVIDANLAVAEEEEDERLARILKSIANMVHDDITMEDDHPGRHEDSKMPILDMKVWMDGDGCIMYQHYQKPMASKQVMHSQSAQSMQCKSNVHCPHTGGYKEAAEQFSKVGLEQRHSTSDH